MMIRTIMYVSTVSDEPIADALAALLNTSRTRNKQAAITGFLIMRGRRVMQMLEDEQNAVRRLYAVIAADRRHHDVVTVCNSKLGSRQFPDWSMAFDDLTEARAASGTGSLYR